jgi:predicted DsbA family dithiol-disulfide isomerase
LKQFLKNYPEVSVEYKPFELRRPPVPRVDPMNDSAKISRFQEKLLPFANKLGVPMSLPFISPHPYTTKAMLGYLFAIDCQKADEYLDETFRAFYVREENLESDEVLKNIAASIGLDAELFLDRILAETDLDRLNEWEEEGKRLGVNSIPAIFEGERLTAFREIRNELEGGCGADGCNL